MKAEVKKDFVICSSKKCWRGGYEFKQGLF